ncbi:MAG: phosphatase PAP2 family protein, partial [Calditrichia bacterium]
FSIAGQITAPYKGLWLTGMLRKLVENSGLHGGAFPSSHVAVAVVVLYFVWHYFPRTGKYAFLPAVIALSLSTVYGQYHYVTDMLSGLLMGIIIGNIGLRHTLRKLGKNHIPDKQLRSRNAGLPEKTPSG